MINPELVPTARELEVIKLVAKGYRNKQIAADLGIKERTVEFHLANLFGLLNVNSRLAVVSKALKAGWINLEDAA